MLPSWLRFPSAGPDSMKTGSLAAMSIALVLSLGACKEKIEADPPPSSPEAPAADVAAAAPTPVAKAKRVTPERIEEIRASRSEEHTSELQSLMRISYAVFCLKKKK